MSGDLMAIHIGNPIHSSDRLVEKWLQESEVRIHLKHMPSNVKQHNVGNIVYLDSIGLVLKNGQISFYPWYNILRIDISIVETEVEENV